MMVLEFFGIICAAIAAIISIGLVAAGASVALLSLVGLIKGFIKSKSGFMVTDGNGAAFNRAV